MFPRENKICWNYQVILVKGFRENILCWVVVYQRQEVDVIEVTRIKAIFHYGRLACAGRAGFENCAHAGLTGSKNNAQPPANYMAFYAFLYILIIHPHLFLDCHK